MVWVRWLVVVAALALAGCEEPAPEVYSFEVSVTADRDAPATLEVFYDGERSDWVVNDGNFSPYVVAGTLLGDAAQRRTYVGQLVVMQGPFQLASAEVRSKCVARRTRANDDQLRRPIGEAIGFSLSPQRQLSENGYRCVYEDGTIFSVIR